jgi:hypothetical protein
VGRQRADQAFIAIETHGFAGVIDDGRSGASKSVTVPLISEPSEIRPSRDCALNFIGAILIFQIAKGHKPPAFECNQSDA